MWGKKQYNLFKNNMESNNQVEVSGHPRFELLKPQYHYLYEQPIRKVNNRFKNFILINTNMAFGNNIKGDEFVIENYGNRFKNIHQIIDSDKHKLNAYISLVLELENKLDKKIILRPHPEEDHDYYINAFKDKKNIHVLYEESVIPWIMASDVMIHPDCTTAIESLLLDKIPISFIPDGLSREFLTELPLKASICFKSNTEIIHYLKSGDYIHEKISIGQTKLLNDYFHNSTNSIENVINSIQSISDNINTINRSQINLFDNIYYFLSSLKSFLLKKENPKLFLQKIFGFNFKSIKYILGQIELNSHPQSEIKFKVITDKLFSFENNLSRK